VSRKGASPLRPSSLGHGGSEWEKFVPFPWNGESFRSKRVLRRGIAFGRHQGRGSGGLWLWKS
jgi:hypothetical protein